MSHTPGPWVMDDQKFIDREDIPTIMIFGPDGLGFGRVAHAYAECGREDELWPNARLIAAAPLLLQRLEEAWKAINSLPEDAMGSASNKEGMTWAVRDELLYYMGVAIREAKGNDEN